MDVSFFFFFNCGAEREGKKKNGKGIAEIKGKKKWQIVLWQWHCRNRGKKNNLPLFFFFALFRQCLCHFSFSSISAQKLFLEMIRSQYFHNFFTINFKWQVVTNYYYWGKKVILVLGSNLNQ